MEQPVTDPELLRLLDADAPGEPVTDPALLSQLDGDTPVDPASVPTLAGVPAPVPQYEGDQSVVAALAQGAQPKAQPEPPQRGWGDRIDRVAAQFPRGVREGLATIAGLPVDLVNNAPRLLNFAKPDSPIGRLLPEGGVGPITPNPAFGSKMFDDVLGAPGQAVAAGVNTASHAVGLGDLVSTDIELPPENAAERFSRRVGNEVGGSVLPASAAIGYGARIGVQGARDGLPLTRSFIEPAAVDPARYAGKEVTSSLMSGAGAAGAGEGYRAVTGKDPGAWTELGGSMAGLGVLGVAKMAGGTAKSLWDAVVQPAGYTDQRVRDDVTGRLANALGAEPNKHGVVDTEQLVDTILRPNEVAEAVPGFQPSLADQTKNPTVAALEYGRSGVDETGQFARRRAGNTDAIDAALGRSEPQGAPGALRSTLEAERNRQLTEAETVALAAQQESNRVAQGLTPTNTAEGRGADIRSALVDANGRLRTQVDALWQPVNEAQVPVDMGPLAERFGVRDTSLSRAEADRFRPAGAEIPGQLAEAGVQPLREATGLRSSLSDQIRDAQSSGRVNEARVQRGYRDDVDTFIDESVPPELREQYEAARAGTRDQKDRFARPGTGIGDVLQPAEGPGRFQVPDSSVPGKFVQPNEGRLSDFESLVREAGTDPRAIRGVEDQIRADVRDRGLLDNPEGLHQYVGNNSRMLDQMPGLRDQLTKAAATRQGLADRQATQTTLQRELGTETQPGRSTVGQFLRFGDEKAENALRGVMSSAKPREAAEELVRFAGNNPEAVEGGRKIFWDIMQKDARAGGATTKTVNGVQPWNPARLKKFLDNPSNAAVAEVLYKDNPEHLENIRKVSEAIQGVDVRNSGKAPNSSGTAQGNRAVLSPESLQSRYYAYMRGQVGGAYLVTSIASTLARNSIRKAQSGAMSKLLDEALLNPDVAAQLLRENNPANRAALARSAKTWAAGDVANFLGAGDTEEDDQKETIMRGGR